MPPNLQALFQDVFGSTGEPPDDASRGWRDFAQQYLAEHVDPRYGVYVGLTRKLTVNATVRQVGPVFLVGISAGTLLAFMTLAHGIMKDSRLFLSVGNPERERGGEINWELLRLDDEEAAAVFYRNVPLRALDQNPIDPTRSRWAMYFKNWCWRLLVYHESAHVLCHHFWLLSKRRYDLQLSESTKDTTTDAAFFHALEMEADRMAASLIAGEVLVHASSDEVAIHAAHSAMMLIPMLFDSNPSRLSDYGKMDHPHPIVRFESMRHATMPMGAIKVKRRAQRKWDKVYDLVLEEMLDAAFKINLPSSILNWFERLLSNSEATAKELRGEVERTTSEAARLTNARISEGLVLMGT